MFTVVAGEFGSRGHRVHDRFRQYNHETKGGLFFRMTETPEGMTFYGVGFGHQGERSTEPWTFGKVGF